MRALVITQMPPAILVLSNSGGADTDREQAVGTPRSSATKNFFLEAKNRVKDKDLVVLVRGEILYILNHRDNHRLMDGLPEVRDVLLFEEDARSFLVWQAQKGGDAPDWHQISQRPVTDLSGFRAEHPTVFPPDGESHRPTTTGGPESRKSHVITNDESGSEFGVFWVVAVGLVCLLGAVLAWRILRSRQVGRR